MFTDSQLNCVLIQSHFILTLALIQTDLGELLCPKLLEIDKITLNQVFKSFKKMNVEHLKSINN